MAKSFTSFSVVVEIDKMRIVIPRDHRYVYVHRNGSVYAFRGRPHLVHDEMAYKPAFKTDYDLGLMVGHGHEMQSGLYKLAKSGYLVENGAVGIYQDR